MAEPKPINHQIQVDSVSRETQQEIHAENRNNQFTGSSFKISQQSDSSTPTDIRELFVQDITINNVTQTSQVKDGKKVVSLTVPKGSASVWKQTTAGTYTLIGGATASEPSAGDLLLREEDTDGNGEYERYWYVFAERDGVVMPVSFGNITQISILGAMITQPDGTQVQSRLDATIDEDGRATIQIEELEFDEMYLNKLYIGGTEIRQLIKGYINVDACGKIEPVENLDPNNITLVTVANKLKEIIDKINTANKAN